MFISKEKLKELEREITQNEKKVARIEKHLGFIYSFPAPYPIPPDDICLKQKLDAICKHLGITIKKTTEKERIRVTKKKSKGGL